MVTIVTKKTMKSSLLSKAFVTGCDSQCEWQLEWFVKNYRKFNTTPLIFVDFGVSDEMRSNLGMMGFSEIVNVEKQQAEGWFYKPQALRIAPAEQKVWLDTDIQVLGDLSDVFDRLTDNMLNMCEDVPWTKRRGEHWHNSGFVGVNGTPQILLDWEKSCKTNPNTGDQEVLHAMMGGDLLKKLKYINTLPQKYNWLRIMLLDGQDSPNKVCMHWTGHKGNLEIRKLIYNE